MAAAADGGEGAAGGGGGGELREGHLLVEAALAGGDLVDARPLGAPLKAVLAALLEHEEAEPPRTFLDGGRHVAVTLGSAGVVLASATPMSCFPDDARTSSSVVESPPGSGRWFALSAEHYPALPLERRGQRGEGCGEGAMADCTGAGDCLVAGMTGGLALGWSARDSLFLGLVSNQLTTPTFAKDSKGWLRHETRAVFVTQ